MCWLRVYAWLRVKIKAKGTGVGGVLPWSVDHRRREFFFAGYASPRGYASK